jgi:hypothetical protein
MRDLVDDIISQFRGQPGPLERYEWLDSYVDYLAIMRLLANRPLPNGTLISMLLDPPR